MVDSRLHYDLIDETARLQAVLNHKQHEREEKQLQFDALQMAVQTIALEKVPGSALEEAAYLQHQVRPRRPVFRRPRVVSLKRPRSLCSQLWAIEEATRAEWKYEKALKQMALRARDEQRAVKADTNVYNKALDKTRRELVRCARGRAAGSPAQEQHTAARCTFAQIGRARCC